MKLSPLLLGLALPLIPSVASAEILSVKAQSANFREQPSEKGSIVYSADKFYPVEVIERKNGWALVRDFEGDKAWVALHALAKQPTIVIQTDHANIREKASTDGEVLFKVEHGEVFKVEERKDHWLKVVDAHGDGGWIRSDMTWGIDGGDTPKAEDDKLLDPQNPKAGKGHVEDKGKSDDKGKTDKVDKNKGDDAKSDCPCRKADEDRAEKKVDLTGKQSDAKAEKTDRKQKGDGASESKAKSGDDSKTEHKKPEHAKPEHSKPEHSKPEHAKPEHAKPEHAKPEHAKPEHADSDHKKVDHANGESSKGAHSKGDKADSKSSE